MPRDILPRVWAADPTLTCKIVGHGWRADRLPGLDPRIEMIGGVEDLDEVFDNTGKGRSDGEPRFNAHDTAL